MRRALVFVCLAGFAVLGAVAVPRSGAATTVPTLRPFCTTGTFRCMSALRVDLPIVADATAAHDGLGPADLRKAYNLASTAVTRGKGRPWRSSTRTTTRRSSRI